MRKQQEKHALSEKRGQEGRKGAQKQQKQEGKMLPKGWKQKGKRERAWFLLALAALSLLRIWLVRGLPIYWPRPMSMCDDVLMRDWAASILGGEWTGPFFRYTFTKEVGFSVYLALLSKLQMSYLLATNLLYMAGALALLYAVSHVLKKKWALCLIYAALIFHPILTSLDTGQRVYRNGLAVALTLWVFGSLLNLYFEIGEKPVYRNVAWAVLAAGSLGVLWNTKSDTVWLLPFTAVVLLVAAALLVKKKRGFRAVLPRLLLLVVPFLGIIIVSKSVAMMNVATYGASEIAYYKPAKSILMSVEAEGRTENISLPTKAFRELCRYSPTLAAAQDEIEAQLRAYDQCDSQKGDGNVEDGWVGWALLEGIADAGYYGSCQQANAFYEDVCHELQAAADAGQITIRYEPFLEAFHLSTAESRKELFSTIGQIWGYVASHCDLESRARSMPRKDDELGDNRLFEAVTHDKASYGGKLIYCYCRGWILFPGYDLNRLRVVIETAEGKLVKKVPFLKSDDVGASYPEIKGSGRCRFFLKWDCKERQEEQDYWIAAYDAEGRQVAKAQIDEQGMHGMEEKDGIGALDIFITPKIHQQERQAALKGVAKCNAVTAVYRAVSYPLALAGAAAYLVFTVLSILEWRRKEYGGVNAWLVITGIRLSLLLLFAGIAVTHLEKCPAITSMYLSAAYPLFYLAALLSILKCAGSISGAINAGKAAHPKNRRPGK